MGITEGTGTREKERDREEGRASIGAAEHPARWWVPGIAVLVVVPLYLLWALVLATGGGDLAAQLAWAASPPGIRGPRTTSPGTEGRTPPTTAC